MRSIWNGAISFGLVSIPIKLVNATENHSVSFRQIHTEDGGRIRYRKVCELEEREVTSAEIGKGYEDADGSIIPITDEDLASLPIPTAKTIEIVAFVPADRIDPMQMDTAYYLSASGVPAAKPYTLLREALKRSQKVAIAKFALRGRERLGMLRVVDDVIAMHGLLWPDEIRAPEGVAPESHVTVRDAELDLADALMDTLGEVDMSTLHDDYRDGGGGTDRRQGRRQGPRGAGREERGGGRRQGDRPDGGLGEQRARGEDGTGRGERGRVGGEGDDTAPLRHRPKANVDVNAEGGGRQEVDVVRDRCDEEGRDGQETDDEDDGREADGDQGDEKTKAGAAGRTTKKTATAAKKSAGGRGGEEDDHAESGAPRPEPSASKPPDPRGRLTAPVPAAAAAPAPGPGPGGRMRRVPSRTKGVSCEEEVGRRAAHGRRRRRASRSPRA